MCRGNGWRSPASGTLYQGVVDSCPNVVNGFALGDIDGMREQQADEPFLHYHLVGEQRLLLYELYHQCRQFGGVATAGYPRKAVGQVLLINI